MRSRPVLLCIAVVVAGCSQKGSPDVNIQKSTPESAPWKTYTSPDGNISFKYPQAFKSDLHKNDPEYISFYLHNEDESIQVVFSLYLMTDPSPAMANTVMDSPILENAKASTPRQEILVGKCKALRQEFAAPGRPEHIKIVVRAPTGVISLTMGYPPERKSELRPVCEQILQSVTIENAK